MKEILKDPTLAADHDVRLCQWSLETESQRTKCSLNAPVDPCRVSCFQLTNYLAPQIFCNNTEQGYATSMVIQRRMYGTETFHRSYSDYAVGFGHSQGDYWAGLNMINHLTSKAGQSPKPLLHFYR